MKAFVMQFYAASVLFQILCPVFFFMHSETRLLV